MCAADAAPGTLSLAEQPEPCTDSLNSPRSPSDNLHLSKNAHTTLFPFDVTYWMTAFFSLSSHQQERQ